MPITSKLKSAYDLASRLHTNARGHITERRSEQRRSNERVHLGREAFLWSQVLGQTTWDWAREQPAIQEQLTRAEVRFDSLRLHAQERVSRLEEELWEWVRQLEDGARPQRLSGPTLAECYVTLQVSPSVSDITLRKSWRALMLECHPDRYAQDPVALERAERQARLVNEAYQTICRVRGL